MFVDLKPAPAYFREHMDKSLRSIGFLPTVSDPCVYVMRRGSESITIITHVDALGVVGSTKAIIADVYAQLCKIYKLSVMLDMQYYLGAHITRDRAKRTIYLSQPAYIADMTERYNVDTSDTAQRLHLQRQWHSM